MSDISSPVPFPATSLSYNAPPFYPSSQAPSIYPSSTPPASCAPSYCPSSPLPSPPSSFLLSVNAPSFYPCSIVDSFLNPSLSSTPIRSSSSVSITPSQPLPFVSITQSQPFTRFNPPPSSPPICPSQYSFPPASATHLPASSQNIIFKSSLLERYFSNSIIFFIQSFYIHELWVISKYFCWHVISGLFFYLTNHSPLTKNFGFTGP